MSEISVKAKKRTLSSKSAVNQLRRDVNVPGIFYSKSTEPIPIYLAEGALRPLVYTAETHIVNLKIDDQDEYKSIVKNVQFDPVTDKVIHFDLQGISADQEIEIEVPIVIEGQSKGVREGGIVQLSMHKLQIACLPGNIPEHVTIDISDLGIGDAVHVKDLKLDNVKLLHHEEVIIVSIVLPRAVVETTTAALPGEESTEPEVISKGKQTEEEE